MLYPGQLFSFQNALVRSSSLSGCVPDLTFFNWLSFHGDEYSALTLCGRVLACCLKPFRISGVKHTPGHSPVLVSHDLQPVQISVCPLESVESWTCTACSKWKVIKKYWKNAGPRTVPEGFRMKGWSLKSNFFFFLFFNSLHTICKKKKKKKQYPIIGGRSISPRWGEPKLGEL